jgi:surface polysaccharide O-acyltransferase-like enzyme
MVWLDNSRLIATFAVVILHVAAGVVVYSIPGSQYWWAGNIYNSSVRWCVPVFVMVSGALLLNPNKMESMGTFYKKRLARILIPLLFWATYCSLRFLPQSPVIGKEQMVIDFLEILLSGRPCYHMWFLYMIIPLYLFTPFFRKIIINSTRQEVVIFVVFTFLMGVLNSIADRGPSIFFNWFIDYIPYFFLGYLIRTDEGEISKTILWCVLLFSSCLTAIGSYILATNSNLGIGQYFYGYLSITVIPMSVSIMYLLKSWTKPIINEKFTRTLSLLTLGVYLIHPLLLGTFGKHGFSPLNFNPAVSVPVIAIIAFSSSLICAWVIYQLPYLKRII